MHSLKINQIIMTKQSENLLSLYDTAQQFLKKQGGGLDGSPSEIIQVMKMIQYEERTDVLEELNKSIKRAFVVNEHSQPVALEKIAMIFDKKEFYGE